MSLACTSSEKASDYLVFEKSASPLYMRIVKFFNSFGLRGNERDQIRHWPWLSWLLVPKKVNAT
jgi:hypothetical protein